jgi:hypothetical protein
MPNLFSQSDGVYSLTTQKFPAGDSKYIWWVISFHFLFKKIFIDFLLCAVLCCAVLYCAVLRCAVLCCAALCCAVLCCVVLPVHFHSMFPSLSHTINMM